MKTFLVSGFAALLSLSSALAQSSTTTGTLVDGPTDQGTCTASGAASFLCSNGAFCTWDTLASTFACVGGSGVVVPETGPPGRVCVSHTDHWDCEDGSLCELVDSVWVCSASTEAAGATAGTCVVHGGHTHGDCSGSCNGIDLGYYDTGLHIASVFVLLLASALGVCIPILAIRWMHTPIFSWVFFAAKHFGTGVIISTAFIHLLYHAFIMFGNVCLGELVFEPVAPAIAMAGVYLVFFVDFFVMRHLKSRTANRLAANAVATADAPRESPASSITKAEKALVDVGHGHCGALDGSTTDYASPQAHFDVVILECGIIFHSIMIGVSLGASGGSQWIPLFCAVTFHQFFEALALGSRIGLLIWPAHHWWKKWVFVAAFTFITPIGIAIGIGVHSSYNPNSGAALLSIGILDSISAGILLYAGLVELLYHDFMLGELATAKTSRAVAAVLVVLAGTLCMSVLGKWA